MADIKVDIEAVRALADRLRRVSGDFAHLGEESGWFDGALGSQRVRDALGGFASNWSHAKDDLRTELEGLAAGAEGAADAYAAVERHLSAGTATDPP